MPRAGDTTTDGVAGEAVFRRSLVSQVSRRRPWELAATARASKIALRSLDFGSHGPAEGLGSHDAGSPHNCLLGVVGSKILGLVCEFHREFRA
jgi:hypothetical protein